MKFMGEDRIVFGSDSVWYGAPQWQVEAFWRFQIPDELQKQYGYPPLTETARRKILGLNSARLYQLPSQGTYAPVPGDYADQIPDSLKTVMEFPGYATDTMTQMGDLYRAAGGQPSNTRYGWLRV
jgi:hypothetical protein